MQNIPKNITRSVILVIVLVVVIFFGYTYFNNGIGGIKTSVVDGNIVVENSVPMDFGDISTWEEYRNDKYGFSIKHPKEWSVQVASTKENNFQDTYVKLSWGDSTVSIFPIGKSGFLCHSPKVKGEFENIHIDEYTEELFTRTLSDGKMYSCTVSLDNYPISWSDKSYIVMNYNASVKDIVLNIVQSISFSGGVIDAVSLDLYGSRIGMLNSIDIDTKQWLTQKDDKIDFSFLYPRDAKIINEGNCYRIEYDLGYAIFLLPVDGDMRCGARTGVGVLPDNVDVTEYLTIQGKEYNASGFHAVMDTRGDMLFKSSTRYVYDFHHLIHMGDVPEYCNGSCLIIGYGIYQEVAKPFVKKDVDETMDTLRAIVESLQYNK
jgi:hypothetical protein